MNEPPWKFPTWQKILYTHAEVSNKYFADVWKSIEVSECEFTLCAMPQELSRTPNPWYFLKRIAGTNGRRTAVQIGGVLQRRLEVYCGDFLTPKLRRRRGTALQMEGVLRYKLEGYRQYFSDTLYRLGIPKQSPMPATVN